MELNNDLEAHLGKHPDRSTIETHNFSLETNQQTSLHVICHCRSLGTHASLTHSRVVVRVCVSLSLPEDSLLRGSRS